MSLRQPQRVVDVKNNIRAKMPKIGPIGLLILDIDNTLFDWFEFWSSSFGAMIEAVAQAAPIAKEQLLSEIRVVHTQHGTSEYAFVLNEVPCISGLPSAQREDVIRVGRDAYRAAREKSERLYPGVLSTLTVIRAAGSGIVAYTESQLFYTARRLIRFGLDGILDAIYCAEDHDIPLGVDVASLRSNPAAAYALQKTRTVLLPRELRKPNPEILLRIVHDFGATPRSALYVGDSLFKDMTMAQDAGVYDAFAGYGQSTNRAGYELLRRVSHWTDAHIAKEKLTILEDVKPSVTLDTFPSLLRYFDFGKQQQK